MRRLCLTGRKLRERQNALGKGKWIMFLKNRKQLGASKKAAVASLVALSS